MDPLFILQKIISCFQEDVDPLFKISKNFQDGSSGFSSTRIFHKLQNYDFWISEISKKNSFWKLFDIFVIFVEVSWCLQRKKLVWGVMDTSENSEIMKMRRFPHNEIKKLLVPNEAEQFYGAFGHIFSLYLP